MASGMASGSLAPRARLARHHPPTPTPTPTPLLTRRALALVEYLRQAERGMPTGPLVAALLRRPCLAGWSGQGRLHTSGAAAAATLGPEAGAGCRGTPLVEGGAVTGVAGEGAVCHWSWGGLGWRG